MTFHDIENQTISKKIFINFRHGYELTETIDENNGKISKSEYAQIKKK
jgi:hypothetical protein